MEFYIITGTLERMCKRRRYVFSLAARSRQRTVTDGDYSGDDADACISAAAGAIEFRAF